jgi:hypothetical protein
LFLNQNPVPKNNGLTGHHGNDQQGNRAGMTTQGMPLEVMHFQESNHPTNAA